MTGLIAEARRPSYDDEKWRKEAWCPLHRRIESIRFVRQSAPLHGRSSLATYQAAVTLDCGEKVTVVMSGRNVQQLEVY